MGLTLAELLADADARPAMLGPLGADPRGTWPHLSATIAANDRLICTLHRILCQPLDSDSTSTTETTEQLNTIAIQLLEAWHVEHAKVAQFGQATVDAVNDVQHAKGITLGFGRVWHGTNETSVFRYKTAVYRGLSKPRFSNSVSFFFLPNRA